VQFRGLLFLICLLSSAASTAYFFATTSQALAYVNDSAHGSTTYGVARPDLVTAGFVKANCAHCHEQHALVPDAKEYLLFDDSNTDQGTNFCFNCHTAVGSYQTVLNRSYSYRAGGWNGGPIDVQAAFGQASSHNLADIVDFAAAPAQGWKYKAVSQGDPADSNACAVCHDPHLVQGDPANNPASGKINGSRGVAITKINSSPVALLAGTMDGYAPGLYLAPDCVVKGANGSEPECNGTSDGTNLPDYVTFCTDCHDNSTTTFGSQTLTPINWAATNEIHGQGNAVNTAMLPGNVPYTSGGTTYVLSCLDCHEPHGSANLSLIRWEVNGVSWSPTTIAAGNQMGLLCQQCHDPSGAGADWEATHHDAGSDPAYNRSNPCTDCHIQADGSDTIDCTDCHYHGAYANYGTVPETTQGPLGRKTF
jgi:hypothetical protein